MVSPVSSTKFLEWESCRRLTLQANDDVVLGSLSPAALRNELGTNGLKFLVSKDATVFGVGRASLDVDLIASIDQSFGGGGGQAGSMFEWLALSAEVEYGRHGVGCDGWKPRKLPKRCPL
jgi:hypothetical protein